MVSNFFIWCAGSDTMVLENCEKSVKTKHVGLGTLVVIPAALGTVSMGYALSLLDGVKDHSYIYWCGGLAWGLIIFAFDRFIVSTHKKQQKNRNEFSNLTFYIRLIFSFVLGVAVSHPFVLLWFHGSITAQIKLDQTDSIKKEERIYQQGRQALMPKLDTLKKRHNCLRILLTAEQSGGPPIHTECGNSSGLSGTGTRVSNLKALIKGVESEINAQQATIDSISKVQNVQKLAYEKGIVSRTNFDYMSQDIALDELKAKHQNVRTAELFIMMIFMLVDILPLIFKTFAPFSMYDKILVDDGRILSEIEIGKRKESLQGAYNRIIDIYSATIGLDVSFDYKKYMDGISKRLNLSKNIFLGITIGTLIAVFVYLHGDVYLSNNAFFTIGTICAVLIGIIGNLLTEGLKVVSKYINRQV